jgi:hypothetical protein
MRKFAGLFAAAIILLAGASPALATGVVHIQPKTGPLKTYTDVNVALDPSSLRLTSSDGIGTLYIGRAACTAVGQLIKCAPYDATYIAHDVSTHIVLTDGTAWLNPSQKPQTIPDSNRKLAAHGVALTMRTKAGTTVTLSGTADVISK